MEEKGQDVRGVLPAFELITPTITPSSSLLDSILLTHVFIISPHGPLHLLESKVLGWGTMFLGWSKPGAGHHKSRSSNVRRSYFGLHNSTNLWAELGEHCWKRCLSPGYCGEVMVTDPMMPAFITAVDLILCQGLKQLWFCRWTPEPGHNGIMSTLSVDWGLVRTERIPPDFIFM